MKYFLWATVALFVAATALSLTEYFLQRNSEIAVIEGNIAFERQRHLEVLDENLLEFGLPDLDRTIYGDISVLVFEDGRLINWSDNAFVPPFAKLSSNEGTYVVEETGGFFLVTRVSDKGLETFAVSSLARRFPFQNEYLGLRTNELVFEDIAGQITSHEGVPINLDGKVLFYFQPQRVDEVKLSALALVLIWLCFIMLVTSAYLYITRLYFRKRVYPWMVIILGLAAKGISLLLPQSPAITAYSTGLWNASLWDIFVSVLLFLTSFDLILNYLSQARPAKRILRLLNRRVLISAFIISLLSFFSHYFYLVVLRRFLAGHPVSLDISDGILFDSPRVLGFAIFLFISLAFLSIIHYLAGLYSKLRFDHRKGLLVIAGGALAFALLPLDAALYIVIPHTLIWGVIYHFDLSKNLIRLSYITFFYIIVIITLASFTAATAIYKDYEKREIAHKLEFAENRLQPRDFMTELNLNKIRENIHVDPTIRARFLSDRLSKDEVRTKIDRQYLTSYFDQYEVTISFFGRDMNQLEGEDIGNADDFFDPLLEFETEYPGLYFIENWENLGRSKYILWVPLGDVDEPLGGIVIELMLKKLIPRSVYPALLSERPERTLEYDYALFRQGALIYSKGDYSFDVFQKPEMWNQLLQSKEGIEANGYHLLAKSDESAIMIIVAPVYSRRAYLVNVCFQFLIMLCFMGVALFVLRSIFPARSLSLANRIQLYLGISFILPLLIVSAVILNLLNSSYRDEIIRNYQKRAIAVSENIYGDLSLFEQYAINRSDLYAKVGDVSRYTQADLNLYNIKGILTVTSQPDIFTNKLVSDRINPLGFLAIEDDPEVSIVLDERVGQLNFKSVYQGVVDHHNGSLLGIISMPFFDSKSHLNRQQIEVFGNLVVVFTVIFLSSVLLGYLVLRNITKPITTLSARLRQTNLENKNEPIEYSGGDEIGQLVDEYNRMVQKLEASKEALAQSQKETAWKEIARQVAHEIKNPLTPMRLKIQQLMRNMTSEEPTYRVLGSLISQIDTLSEIADSFSAFAKMPAPNNEIVGMSELTNEVCSLYSSEDVAITCEIDQGLKVFADPNILGRVLNNLVINGIQAVKDEKAHLQVNLTGNKGKVILKVTDNGLGIPEDVRHKIFTPYFSTKEKGSGIGLAIAKKGIEQAGGSIWFDTEERKGTTFTVILPEAGDRYM